MPEPLKYIDFTNVTFIRGGTLERFMHDDAHSHNGWEWYWVYQPTTHMTGIQCDGCIKRHNPKNLDCSATLGRDTSATDPNKFYTYLQHNTTVDIDALGYVDFPNHAIKGCLVKTF